MSHLNFYSPSLSLSLSSTLSCLQVDCVSDLLKSLKALMVRCCVWDRVTTIDNLRLDTTHRMLNIPHFNAKMNALKEVIPSQESSLQPLVHIL